MERGIRHSQVYSYLFKTRHAYTLEIRVDEKLLPIILIFADLEYLEYNISENAHHL